MSVTVKNISRRPVSLHCNSGRTVHLPPDGQVVLSVVEIAANPMFDKLTHHKLLQVVTEEHAAAVPTEAVAVPVAEASNPV